MMNKIFFGSGSLKENFQNSLKAKFWFPAQDEYRMAYNEFINSQKIMKELNMNNFGTLEILKKTNK